MTLFKCNDSILELTSPVTNKKYKFRRYKTRDEKNLLIAKQSADPTDIYNAILQNVQNCCLEPSFDATKLPEFELSYFFIKLRGESVSNIIPMNFTDNQDQKEYQLNVNIENVSIANLITDPKQFVIPITDKTGIKMKYPMAALFKDNEFLVSNTDTFEQFIIKCIDMIYTETEVFSPESYTSEELIEWLNDLPLDVYAKISDFIDNLPTLHYEITYKNSLGNDRRIVLSKLGDFFMLQ